MDSARATHELVPIESTAQAAVKKEHTERVQAGGFALELPTALLQPSVLDLALSVEAWDLLSETDHNMLLRHLPTEMASFDPSTLREMLSQLFSGGGKSFCLFGMDPLALFRQQLFAGELHPAVVFYREHVAELERQSLKLDMALYNVRMVDNLVLERRAIDIHDTISSYRNLPAYLPSFNVAALQLEDDISKVEQDEFLQYFEQDFEVNYDSSSDSDEAELSPHECDLLDPGTPVWTFFLAIEHVFLFAPRPGLVTLSYLLKKVPEITPLDFEGPTSPRDLMLTALKFLSHPPLPPGSLWKEDRNRIHRERRFARRHRYLGADSSPEVSAWQMVRHEPEMEDEIDGLGCWRWCDPGLSRQKWVSLEQIFFYLLSRGPVTNYQLDYTAIPYSRIGLTIGSRDESALAAFHQQESERFANYQHSYQYVAEYKSTVPPLRWTGQNARPHPLLKSPRPGCVTLLALVHDAAARLPYGLGSRQDICSLLYDSQYVLRSASATQLNNCVSGTLDRLRTSVNATVAYDADQKLWSYLHRRRTPLSWGKKGSPPPPPALNFAVDPSPASVPIPESITAASSSSSSSSPSLASSSATRALNQDEDTSEPRPTKRARPTTTSH